MKRKLFILLCPTIVLVVLAFSCVSPKGEADSSSDSVRDTVTAEQLEYILPSPSEILNMTRDLGMDFNFDLINPIKNPTDFSLFRNQALNFGVYITDFSYLLLFEKHPESIKYLYQIQEMANLLGVQEYFNDDFFNKILSSLNQPDTLKELTLDQTALFFNKMESIGNKDLVLYTTTGAVIEAIFLSTQIFNEKLVDDNTISAVSNIAIIFDSFFLHFSSAKPNDKSVDNLFNDLNEIRSIITSMSIKQTSNAIRKDGNLIISSGFKHDINDYNIGKLKVMVNKVRSKIVNQEY